MLNDKPESYCATSRRDFCDLQSLSLNCALERSPEGSR